MSEDIKQLAKLAWDRKLSYLNLQERFQDELTFAYSEGMWCADRETLLFSQPSLTLSKLQWKTFTVFLDRSILLNY